MSYLDNLIVNTLGLHITQHQYSNVLESKSIYFKQTLFCWRLFVDEGLPSCIFMQGQSTAYLNNNFVVVEMLPLDGWVGELEGATIYKCSLLWVNKSSSCQWESSLKTHIVASLMRCVPFHWSQNTEAVIHVTLLFRLFLCCQVISAHYSRLLQVSLAIISKWPFSSPECFYGRKL